MTLEEAIAGLEDLSVDDPHYVPERRREAVKLGIEALKRVEVRRDKLSWKFEPLLPGETTD